jgi:hypothetical protein
MNNLRAKQEGAVLIISMVILLLLGIIASITAQTNALQLQMAGNDEAKSDAVQRALGIVDAIMGDENNTPIVGGIGYKICAVSGASDEDCDAQMIDIAEELADIQLPNTSATFHATRVGPLETTIPVMSENMANSASQYRAVRYEIVSEFDGTEVKLGRARVAQGVLVKIPAPGQ